jgi:hypothetical protein
VAIQSDSHTHGTQTILATLYDGALFGEKMVGLASSEEVPRRGASVIAQEDTYLLELDPERYYGIMQKNAGSVDLDILKNLRKASCFAHCSDYQLSPLSTHIRIQNNHYGETIVEVGAYLDGLMLLVEGLVTVEVPVKDGWVHRSNERAGASFNSASVQDRLKVRPSPYRIQVSSATATFFIITKKAFNYLPDQMQQSVQKKLMETPDAFQDPEWKSKGLARKNRLWEQKKASIISYCLKAD